MLAPEVDAAFDHLIKSLLLERMTGMPRWHLTSPPTPTPVPKVQPRKALILAPPLPGLEDDEPLPRLTRGEVVALETAHLLGTDDPESIARRLGYQDAATLERVLDRWGRHDLSAAVRRARVGRAS